MAVTTESFLVTKEWKPSLGAISSKSRVNPAIVVLEFYAIWMASSWLSFLLLVYLCFTWFKEESNDNCSKYKVSKAMPREMSEKSDDSNGYEIFKQLTTPQNKELMLEGDNKQNESENGNATTGESTNAAQSQSACGRNVVSSNTYSSSTGGDDEDDGDGEKRHRFQSVSLGGNMEQDEDADEEDEDADADADEQGESGNVVSCWDHSMPSEEKESTESLTKEPERQVVSCWDHSMPSEEKEITESLTKEPEWQVVSCWDHSMPSEEKESTESLTKAPERQVVSCWDHSMPSEEKESTESLTKEPEWQSIVCDGKKFDPTKIIGKGSFGTCVLVVENESKALRAMKQIDRKSFNESETIIMSKLNGSPYIVSYFGYDELQDKVRIFMGYAQYGNLEDFMEKNFKTWDESEKGSILQDIIEGVAFIHSKSIVHADLKGANVLLTSPNGCGKRAVISDFGLAMDTRDPSYSIMNARGTILFFSPELAREQKLPNTFASDTWAVGCLAVRVAVGEPPWAAAAKRGNAALLYTIGSAKKPPIPVGTTRFLAKLYEAALVLNPEDRKTMHSIRAESKSWF